VTEITADDLPEDVPLPEKVASAINMATLDLIETTLVESCAMAGLKYEKVADIAVECGLEPDELNEMGLGVYEDPSDREYEEPHGTRAEQCASCDDTQTMDKWDSKRGGWRILSVKCQTCGETGSRWSCGVGDPQYFGILDT